MTPTQFQSIPNLSIPRRHSVKFLDNIKMGPKLILSFLIMALITASMGVFAIMQMRAADAADTQLYRKPRCLWGTSWR